MRLPTILIGLLFLLTDSVASDCEGGLTLPSFDAGSALVFGEMHGTAEAPVYFLRAICTTIATYADTDIIVGLEYPQDEQQSLDRYLESPPGVAADRLLLSSKFWNREAQDGRSSGAIFALL